MAGNMREVYVDTQASLEHINRMREKSGPYDAEAVPGKSPCWHLLCVDHGNTAASHLIGRRFGIYQPIETRDAVVRGRLRTISRSMFPGYLFVFVWDIDRHARRIMACTGVRSIMRDDNKFVVVPDDLIDRIRRMENTLNPVNVLPEDLIQPTKAKKNKKKKHKRYAKAAVIPAQQSVTIDIYPKSYWRDFENMDAAERIGLLRYELSLSS